MQSLGQPLIVKSKYINYGIIIKMNSKALRSGILFQNIIINFIRGKQGKDVNLAKISELASTVSVTKLQAVNLYRIISHDPYNKLQSIIRSIDKNLIQDTSNNRKDEQKRGFSIILHAFRLQTLIKYDLPFDETIQIILEHILLNQLTDSDLLVILHILECRPTNISSNFSKLLKAIFDILEQRLQKKKIYPSFIKSVTKFLSSSIFKIPEKLLNFVNKSIDESLHFYNAIQHQTLTHYIRTKSINQWRMIGNMEYQQVKKRIIYQYIINKQYQGLQSSKFLPGRPWLTAEQLQESLKVVWSLGVKQSYIDIFPTIKSSYSDPWEGYQALQRPQFTKYYIRYLFFTIKNGYQLFDIFSLFKILRTIRSFFSSNIKEDLNPDYFEKYSQDYGVNMLILSLILNEIGRLNLKEKEKIKKITDQMNSIIYASIIKTRNISNQQFNKRQWVVIFNYLSFILTNFLCDFIQKQPLQYYTNILQIIDTIYNKKIDKKYTENQHSKFIAYVRFVRAVTSMKNIKLGNQSCLIGEEVRKEELKRILQPIFSLKALQQMRDQDQILESKWQNFQEKHKIVKNLYLQPNLRAKYGIINRKTSKIMVIFEFSQIFTENLEYEFRFNQEKGQYMQQRYDFTLGGEWKRLFYNHYYESQYVYCRNQLQLAQKMHKVIFSTNI